VPGAFVLDTYLWLRWRSPSRKLADRVAFTPALQLTSSPTWLRIDTQGSSRYLLTVETAEDLPADARSIVVQYRFFSERGRLRRDADVAKAWSPRYGYHELAPRLPVERVSTFIVLTPPGTRVVDVGLGLAGSSPASITCVAVRPLGPRTLVPAYDVPSATPRSDLRLAVIADTFTITALRLEAHVLEIPRQRFDRALEAFAPDLVLVESAWNGNDGAWQYCVAGVKPDDRRLAELVEHARRLGVPVLFWNKEDPAHYDDFIRAAAMCDAVATTDAGMIPRYVAELGHDRVFALPFCIQPDIHNPRQPHDHAAPRLPAAAFLGSWWASKFDARRDAQERLFDGARDVGLEIFDRYLTFNEHERYRMPPEWLPYVHGTLSYEQALSAYRRYGVLLNVNTVTGSPTMFSRRALEAAACGAAVITNPSAGTDAALGELAITAATSEECRDALTDLLADESGRVARAHLAYRHVHHEHSWSARLDAVTAFCNIARPARSRPKVSVVLATKRPAGADRIVRWLAAIEDPSFEREVVLVTAFDPAELSAERELHALGAQVLVERPGETLGECLNRGAAAASGTYIAKVDDDDVYGPNYFQDLLLAGDYSRADIVGKQCHYQHFEVTDTTVLRYPDHEHRFTTFVCGSTLLARSAVYESVQFPRQRVGEDTEFLRRAVAADLRVFSADRFNYVSERRADVTSHTWREGHGALLNSPLTQEWCSGLPRDHIEV
jgi:hypothetical protein